MTTSHQWLHHLPTSVQAKIKHRPNLLKIIENVGWLFLDKILRMIVGLLVGVWVARYLGAEQFGLFNYAIAFVSIFTALATLGLNGIVVRDLVKNPDAADVTLGTAAMLQILGGVLTLVLMIFAISIMRPDDTLAITMVTILGFAMVLKATDVVKYWFESEVRSKYVVWVENLAFLAFTVVKIVIIFNKAPLLSLVWVVVAESLFVSGGFLAIYIIQGQKLSTWRYQYSRAKTLLKDSWPLILSGFAAMIYMRIDQIMLGHMLGNEAVGIYSAAVRLSEVWYFMPIAIAGSVFPAIIEARNVDPDLYYSKLERLFELLAFVALMLALIISFSSNWVIKTLYGPSYEESATVLIIHVWTGIFVFMGVASSRWFIIENLQRYTLYRTLAGGIVNILLNIALIPKFGVVGSAWATVIAQAVASVIFNGINKKTRTIFRLQLEAMFMARYFRAFLKSLKFS